jgi:hypothetical protein
VTGLRWRRISVQRALSAGVGVLLIATVASGCSRPSGGGEGSGGEEGSRSGGPAASQTADPGACLTAHGVAPSVLNGLLGSGSAAPVSPATMPNQQTLREAGLACWTSVSGTAMGGVLQDIVTCVAGRGVSTAHTGSALADLLLLDSGSATVGPALAACRPSGHAGGK